MPKILAFGASNSRRSINQQFAAYVAQRFVGYDLTLIDLNDFEMPLYGIDKERENGIPAEAHTFKSLIADHDLIIISFAEHNGSYTVAFKNLMDWTSRLVSSLWADKPMFLLSTSPGRRGGMGVLEVAQKRVPHMGGFVIAQFSLPAFNLHFSPEAGIIDAELSEAFEKQLALVVDYMNKGKIER
ncbi:MAG: NAD(P)H-dependent oxidoreductase [Saprospiraceae bacterium]